jgi:hypothetical protein
MTWPTVLLSAAAAAIAVIVGLYARRIRNQRRARKAIHDGPRVYFVRSIKDPEHPTVAELAAGTEITGWLAKDHPVVLGIDLGGDNDAVVFVQPTTTVTYRVLPRDTPDDRYRQ